MPRYGDETNYQTQWISEQNDAIYPLQERLGRYVHVTQRILNDLTRRSPERFNEKAFESEIKGA